MIAQETVLVQLVRLIDHIPTSPPSARPRRGRPPVYSDELFLKALVVMIVKRLHRVGELLAVLEEPTPETRALRGLLCERGRYRSRRTFERRLRTLPETLPERIGCMGRHLAALLLRPWEGSGRAVALDIAPCLAPKAECGTRRTTGRQASCAPLLHRHRGGLDQERLAWVVLWMEAASRHDRGRRMDTAGCPANPGQRPRQPDGPAADRSAARRGSLRARRLALQQRPKRARGLHPKRGLFLVASGRGPYPHADAGVEVRRIFHLLRHRAIENFNGHFKAIFEAHGPVRCRSGSISSLPWAR
jgi:hypothetical protein